MADDHGAAEPLKQEQAPGEDDRADQERTAEQDRTDQVEHALRAKEPDEEVEEALGAPPEPPAEGERKSAAQPHGEPPD